MEWDWYFVLCDERERTGDSFGVVVLLLASSEFSGTSRNPITFDLIGFADAPRLPIWPIISTAKNIKEKTESASQPNSSLNSCFFKIDSVLPIIRGLFRVCTRVQSLPSQTATATAKCRF